MKTRKNAYLIIIIAIILILIYKGVDKVSMPGRAIKKINEDCYNIEININDKKVIVDDEEVELTDFLGLSKKKIDNMIEENSLKNYIENNLIGNIKLNDTEIVVFNPFSTNGLSIKIKEEYDESFFDEYDKVIKYKEVANNMYTLKFENATDTKETYLKLKEDSRVRGVEYNYKVYLKNLGKTEIDLKSVQDGKQAWGTRKMGLDTYSTKLNYAEDTSNVKVAVLDSGIRRTHEVFDIEDAPEKMNYSKSYDYADDDNNFNDIFGHGTAVAGVIAESTSNNVQIMPIKVLKDDGSGEIDYVLNALDDLVRIC